MMKTSLTTFECSAALQANLCTFFLQFRWKLIVRHLLRDWKTYLSRTVKNTSSAKKMSKSVQCNFSLLLQFCWKLLDSILIFQMLLT